MLTTDWQTYRINAISSQPKYTVTAVEREIQRLLSIVILRTERTQETRDERSDFKNDLDQWKPWALLNFVGRTR